MTRRIAAVLAAALLVVAGIAGATGGVAAASSDDGAFGIDVTFVENVSTTEMIVASAKGFFGGLSPSNFFADALGNEPDASNQATRLKTYMNERNASFVNHTNKVLDHYNASVSNGTYVLQLNIAADPDKESSENRTIYFVGTSNDTAITDYQFVNSTSKTVDRTETLDSFEAKQLNADVRDYYENYVQTGEVPKKGYYISLASKYGDVSEITVKRQVS